MKKKVYYIFIILLANMVFVPMFSSFIYAQRCPTNTFGASPGSFKIGNKDVTGFSGTDNNTMITICLGDVVPLKNTDPGVSQASTWYYPEQPAGSPASIGASGFNNISSYKFDKAGVWLFMQSSTGASGAKFACQVINVITPKQPVVEQITSCSNNEFIITFKNDPNNNFDQYQISYKPVPGPPIVQNVSFTAADLPYTVPPQVGLGSSPRAIEIRGYNKIGTSCAAPAYSVGPLTPNSSTVPRPSLVSLEGVGGGTYNLAFSGQNGTAMKAYLKESGASYNFSTPYQSFISQSNGIETVGFTVPDKTKQYCLKLEAVDNCPGTIPQAHLSNDELCTIPFSVTTDPVNKKNIIKWTSLPSTLRSFTEYKLERTDKNGTKTVLLQTPFISANQQEDNNLTCGETYTYQLKGTYGSYTLTEPIQVKTTWPETLSNIPYVFTTIENGHVTVKSAFDITPTNLAPNSYKFYKLNPATGSYDFLAKNGLGTYDDLTADFNSGSFCYQVTWESLCGNESPKNNPVCTIFLKADGQIPYWTSQPPQSDGVGYYKLTKLSPSVSDFNVGKGTTWTTPFPASDGQVIELQVTSLSATGKNGPSVSNIIKILRPSRLMAAEAFTPNGDINNDIFLAQGIFVKKVEMSVYDRWGNILFFGKTDDLAANANFGWNGLTPAGERAPQGNYVYKIVGEDSAGNTLVKEGSFVLLY